MTYSRIKNKTKYFSTKIRVVIFYNFHQIKAPFEKAGQCSWWERWQDTIMRMDCGPPAQKDLALSTFYPANPSMVLAWVLASVAIDQYWEEGGTSFTHWFADEIFILSPVYTRRSQNSSDMQWRKHSPWDNGRQMNKSTPNQNTTFPAGGHPESQSVGWYLEKP